jgi:hypothetical protein
VNFMPPRVAQTGFSAVKHGPGGGGGAAAAFFLAASLLPAVPSTKAVAETIINAAYPRFFSFMAFLPLWMRAHRRRAMAIITRNLRFAAVPKF